ncbi:MAG: hypothetical protein HeimC3_43040 [Candidatus Heimdallarchaeota archaeon LC_3]|nr:MAG: hypothetical protein HeimC3_43040 [Candidatus Heimdallarchaeota archaeon LC_3]
MHIKPYLLFLLQIMILLSLINSSPYPISGNTRDPIILALYGSNSDMELIKELGQGIKANITLINASTQWDYKNSSFVDQFKSIWIFYSSTDKPFLPKITFDWIEKGKGLFIMSAYFNIIQHSFNLNNFGILGISPLIYPLQKNSSTILELEILPNDFIDDWPNNETTLQVKTKSSLITIDKSYSSVISGNIPIQGNSSDKVRSGIFIPKNTKEKIIIGTFSIDYIPKVNNERTTKFEFRSNLNGHSNNMQISDPLINIFTLLGEFSTSGREGTSSTLVTPEVNEIVLTLGLISVIGTFLFFLLSKWKEIILTIMIFIIGIIAHISYIPSRRRLSRTDLLENDTRSRILMFIEDHPRGIHLREVQRNVGCGVSTLLWHLQTLSDFNLIESTKVGRYTIFLPINSDLGENGESILPIQSEQAKKIWEFLKKKKKPLDLATIAKKTDCHVETARYHLKKFENSGYVNKIKEKKIFYFIPPIISKKMET